MGGAQNRKGAIAKTADGWKMFAIFGVISK